ncbi:hypothetical protein COXBURSA334_0111 [Coxiella burnetii Q321]|nr:hypothetical protein COXBURSA334_0111 [Coxiella burnetii Q321]
MLDVIDVLFIIIVVFLFVGLRKLSPTYGLIDVLDRAV